MAYKYDKLYINEVLRTGKLLEWSSKGEPWNREFRVACWRYSNKLWAPKNTGHYAESADEMFSCLFYVCTMLIIFVVSQLVPSKLSSDSFSCLLLCKTGRIFSELLRYKSWVKMLKWSLWRISRNLDQCYCYCLGLQNAGFVVMHFRLFSVLLIFISICFYVISYCFYR